MQNRSRANRTATSVVALAVGASATFALGQGCGDDDSTGASTTTGSGATGASASAGSGGNGGESSGSSTGGSSTGGGLPCADASDCGPDSDCQTPSCVDGSCDMGFEPAGTPIDAQTAGDCKVLVCDGRGGLQDEQDDADTLDDGKQCTTDSCAGGTPSNLPSAAGAACSEAGGTHCDGDGSCVECVVNADCTSGVCQANACVPASCADGVENGTETDVDCGGPCGPCADGKACVGAADCTSGVCGGGVCQAPTCSDGVENGPETDVDCGASCPDCADGKACTGAGDCQSGICTGNLCQCAPAKLAICGRSDAGLECALSNGATSFGASSTWSPAFGGAAPPQARWATIQTADVDGDGASDVCGRQSDGIACALSNGTTLTAPTLWTSDFSDAQFWNAAPDLWATIQFPDVNGDGRADVCGRAAAGIVCAVSNGAGFGPAASWSSHFSDAQFWNGAPSLWGTIQFPDVNGDGMADVCGRQSDGIACALSNGAGFGAAVSWTTHFSNAQFWDSAAAHWATIQFPDVDGDGKADVCGRGSSGMQCGLSNGAGFGSVTLWAANFSNGNLWNTKQSYWGTIQFPDVNGDGKADACGRGAGGLVCAISTGSGFAAAANWEPAYSDGQGWDASPAYWATIQFPDVTADGKADVCGRAPDGIRCSVSDGSDFLGATLWAAGYGDAAFWHTTADHWATIQYPVAVDGSCPAKVRPGVRPRLVQVLQF